MPTKISGLPAHILLVHAVVVLVPLAALLTICSAVWPRARRRLGIATPIVAFVAMVLVPVTTHAGEWLRDRVPASSLVRRHAELGDELLPFAIGTFLLAVVVWWVGLHHSPQRPNWTRLPTIPSRMLTPATVISAVLAVAVSVGTVVQVYRIGESGSRAVWHDGFSNSAHPHD